MNDSRMNFPVGRTHGYDFRPPSYDIPLEIGCFSIDAESRYRNDGSQMKYLSLPERPDDLYMDLNEGFREYIHVFEDTDSTYSAILRWILSHQYKIRKRFVDQSSASPKIDFVLFRGLLTDISSTLYERNEDWLIHATKFNSVIYLCDIWTDRKIESEEQATEEQKRMTTWGFKFEQYMVSDTISSKPDTSAPVNENEKYFAVFKGKLGHHRLLFSAEMDSVHPDPIPPKRYVELKTSRIITGERQERNFRRYKLLKWYLQSYFAGVPEVICGFRNDEGIVRKLETFKVRDMPRQARGLWSSAAYLNFTSRFLDHVKKCVIKEETVYEFYYRPGSDTITCEELGSDSAFLPKWYTSRVRVI